MRCLPTTVVLSKLEELFFHMVSNIISRFFLLSQNTRVSQRQTDGHNYDTQDSAGVASRSKKKLAIIATKCNHAAHWHATAAAATVALRRK